MTPPSAAEAQVASSPATAAGNFNYYYSSGTHSNSNGIYGSSNFMPAMPRLHLPGSQAASLGASASGGVSGANNDNYRGNGGSINNISGYSSLLSSSLGGHAVAYSDSYQLHPTVTSRFHNANLQQQQQQQQQYFNSDINAKLGSTSQGNNMHIGFQRYADGLNSPASSFTQSPDHMQQQQQQQQQLFQLQQYHLERQQLHRPSLQQRRKVNRVRRRLLLLLYTVVLVLVVGYMFYSVSFVMSRALDFNKLHTKSDTSTHQLKEVTTAVQSAAPTGDFATSSVTSGPLLNAAHIGSKALHTDRMGSPSPPSFHSYAVGAQKSSTDITKKPPMTTRTAVQLVVDGVIVNRSQDEDESPSPAAADHTEDDELAQLALQDLQALEQSQSSRHNSETSPAYSRTQGLGENTGDEPGNEKPSAKDHPSSSVAGDVQQETSSDANDVVDDDEATQQQLQQLQQLGAANLEDDDYQSDTNSHASDALASIAGSIELRGSFQEEEEEDEAGVGASSTLGALSALLRRGTADTPAARCATTPSMIYSTQDSKMQSVILDAFIMPSAKAVGIVAPSFEYARQYHQDIRNAHEEAGTSHVVQLSDQTVCIFQGTPDHIPLQRHIVPHGGAGDLSYGATEVLVCPLPPAEWLAISSTGGGLVFDLLDPSNGISFHAVPACTPKSFMPRSALRSHGSSGGKNSDGSPSKSWELAVCTQPLYGRHMSSQLKPWIEYYRLLGVQHFFVYVYELDDDSVNILLEYEKQGVVTIVRWGRQQLKGFNDLPASELKHGGDDNAGPAMKSTESARVRLQMPAMNHCLWKFGKELSEWLLFVDVDEYLFHPPNPEALAAPRDTSTQPTPLVKQLRAGSFEISDQAKVVGSETCSYQVRPMHFDGPNPDSTDFAMELMKRAQRGESSACVLVLDMYTSRQPNVTWDQWEGGHTKVLLRTQHGELLGVHKVYQCAADTTRYMTIDPEQWRLNHYFTASASVQRKLPQEDLGDQQTKADFLRKMVAQHGYLHPNFTGKRVKDESIKAVVGAVRKNAC